MWSRVIPTPFVRACMLFGPYHNFTLTQLSSVSLVSPPLPFSPLSVLAVHTQRKGCSVRRKRRGPLGSKSFKVT